ncbi:MAG TPA: ABC transporter ATP-binding protein [Solirubrobacterales bacterium]
MTARGETRVERVSVRLGEGPSEKLVVRDCSFVLPAGAVTAMIGPSGCGKSTIGAVLAGFERASSGRVRLDGREVSGPSPERQILFQETALMPWLTTLENVVFAPGARRRDKRRRERAQKLLERVGLRAFADRYPSQLSGGMQRRAELARALLNDPALLILDEPFRGLDAMTRELMQEYTAELLGERRQTTLLVTTDIDEALLLADRVLVMSNRPTRVREQLEVDLPRPRTHEAVLTDERCQELKRHVIELLTDEVMRSFAAQAAAPADDVSRGNGAAPLTTTTRSQ